MIGVLPRSFRFFPYPADIFYPLRPDRSQAAFPSFSVTLAQADADVARMILILTAEFGRPAPLFNAEFRPRLRLLDGGAVGVLPWRPLGRF